MKSQPIKMLILSSGIVYAATAGAQTQTADPNHTNTSTQQAGKMQTDDARNNNGIYGSPSSTKSVGSDIPTQDRIADSMSAAKAAAMRKRAAAKPQK
jgi:hypothetical protein